MKCPLCGSDIAAGSKYCPICGADVEAAAQRARHAAQTQAMPRQAQQAPRPQAQQQRRAVPMNSSMPPQQPQNLRSFDTSKMSGTPKWPIVLIVVLALVIVVALVLIFWRPWESSAPETRQVPSTAVSSVSDASTSAPAEAASSAVAETPAESAAEPAQPAALSDADAYAQLTASYDQLADFDQRISAIAADYNNGRSMEEINSDAVALQAQIQSAADALSALNIADGSAYASTKDAIANLYNDLGRRIGVLAEASQFEMNGDSDSATAALMRDNDENNVNKFKTDYEQNYDAARPVQVG